jgi:hypothetical protein
MVYSNLKCIALAIMLFMSLSSSGQRQIKYGYDGAGNRIKRIGFVDRSYRQHYLRQALSVRVPLCRHRVIAYQVSV